ncbi:hypothetical protein ACFE04_031327 [Oxalis oulophora]
MKTQILPLLILIILLVVRSSSTCTTSRNGALNNHGGGWTPIKNTEDSHVMEIGKFAVEECNKKYKTSLVFNNVISGKYKVVSRTNYVLIINVSEDGWSTKYEVVVWEKPWMHFKKLISFMHYKCE